MAESEVCVSAYREGNGTVLEMVLHYCTSTCVIWIPNQVTLTIGILKLWMCSLHHTGQVLHHSAVSDSMLASVCPSHCL